MTLVDSDPLTDRLLRFPIFLTATHYWEGRWLLEMAAIEDLADQKRRTGRSVMIPRWRRRMIALGSGEPTRAICSSLIAQAFQSVNYPILPEVKLVDEESRREILHIRHHTLYTPRDFDISQFFSIVKPTIETGFDYQRMAWAKGSGAQSDETSGRLSEA